MPLTPEEQQRLDAYRSKMGQGQPAVQIAQPIDVSGQPTYQAISQPSALNSAKAIGSAIVAPPLAAAKYVGEKLDPYTGAPIRAGVGEALGITPEGTVTRQLKEILTKRPFAAQVDPNVPTGTDITKAGLTKAGVNPAYAQTTANAVGPLVGAGLDVATLATPFTPAGLTRAVTAAPELAEAGAAIGRTAAEGVGNAAAKGLFNTGEILTGGNLNAAKSMKATQGLSATEQMAPWFYNQGAKNKLSGIRGANAANPTIVQGSGDALIPVAEQLNNARDKVLNAPNIGAMADKLKKLTSPDAAAVEKLKSIVGGDVTPAGKDLSVGQIDELLNNVDTLSYTPMGNNRQVQSLLKPDIAATRKALVNQLQKTPEGQALLDARAKSSDLLTASKSRGKLGQMLGYAAAIPTKGASLAINPGTYHRIVGAARLPKAAVETVLSGVNAAYSSGGPQAAMEAFQSFAKQYPTLTEAALRDLALAPSRTDQYQNAPTINVGGK